MFRLWNRFLFVLLCAIFVSCLFSCGFMDLRPVEVFVIPSEANSLLADNYTPVILKFSTEMEKNEAEGIMQISSDSGVTEGDRFWIGNDLYFTPVAGWTAGIRYTLTLMGTIRSLDGRELKIEKFVPFFAINKKEPPFLEKVVPADGESIGTNDVVLEYHFSCVMDRLSVEAALTVEGIGNKSFEWSVENSILRVIPEKQLSPWSTYRWSLKESAKSKDGVPLPKTFSGQFITNLDQTFPFVERVMPVMNSDGTWFPTGKNIETGLMQGQGIAVEFNKIMDESALNSIRFEPSLAGRAEFLSEKSVVYIFSRELEPEKTYTLIVSGDAKDSEGLKIGADYRLNFTVDIPYLKVISFYANDNLTEMENFSPSQTPVKLKVEIPEGIASFSIHFSFMLNNEEKQNAALKIQLFPFFPGNLSPVALRSVSWVSDDILFMTWESLKASDETTNYYKLTIPGGKGGIKSLETLFMKEDVILYLEAIE